MPLLEPPSAPGDRSVRVNAMSNSTYDADFYAWANEQAALLRAGRLSDADIANIAEEIESMGRSEKRALLSRLTVLLLHPLKWRFQPDRRSRSWEVSIANTRDDLTDQASRQCCPSPCPPPIVGRYGLRRWRPISPSPHSPPVAPGPSNRRCRKAHEQRLRAPVVAALGGTSERSGTVIAADEENCGSLGCEALSHRRPPSANWNRMLNRASLAAG